MRKGICFFFLFILTAMLLSSENKPVVTIMYSSSLNGNLDGCSCPSHPRAGLVKRGYFLNHLKNRDNTLLLDAGNILGPGSDPLLADYIFSLYNDLGYHGIATGVHEFSNGIDALLRYRASAPLLAHNLTVCPTEDSCFLFSLTPEVVKTSTHSVGIFSLFDPALVPLLKNETGKKIKGKDPSLVAGNMVTLLQEDETDIIILLFHGYYRHAVKLARQVKGIDLIILGYEQKLLHVKEGKTWIVSPGEEGNNLGILTICLAPGGSFIYTNTFKKFNYSIDPDDILIRKRIEEYNTGKTGMERSVYE